MSMLGSLYRPALGLVTDLYQLTMAYGYWKRGLARRTASFYWSFRSAPFGGKSALLCGIQNAVEFLEAFRFDQSDADYLATLAGLDGRPLFEDGFLDALTGLRFSCDVDAVPEGTVVYPHTPLLRVTGPLIQAQLVETPLLNLLNFQTLIATKASRIVAAAAGAPVLEFGMRRAQGIDGAISASRAAYVGGCSATSNVLAGKLLGIPVRGTHAHSWVMIHENELKAFQEYAAALPSNCVFLVDTYDTIQGVQHAIQVGDRLRAQGQKLAGIRLDSGDLGKLSRAARKLLDDAGWHETKIVASNDLDEASVGRLTAEGAPIDVWGVGTRLVTAFDQPALGGIYKLCAVQDADGAWQPKMKVSQQEAKRSLPGQLYVWRYRTTDGREGDLVQDLVDGELTAGEAIKTRDLAGRPRELKLDQLRPLFRPLMRGGRACGASLSLSALREMAAEQLHAARSAPTWDVLLDERLAERRNSLMNRTDGRNP